MEKWSVNEDRSLRKESGKNVGGQEGYDGIILAVLVESNKIKKRIHNDCVNYGRCMSKVYVKETRKVVDTVLKVKVTTYELMYVEGCPLCGEPKDGKFFEPVKSRIQYGTNLEAPKVSLNTVGTVSIKITYEIPGSVYGVPIATGIIKSMVTCCAERVKPVLAKIKSKLIEFEVVHFDETVACVDGNARWLHNVSNDLYTCLIIINKRRFNQMKETWVFCMNLIVLLCMIVGFRVGSLPIIWHMHFVALIYLEESKKMKKIIPSILRQLNPRVHFCE